MPISEEKFLLIDAGNTRLKCWALENRQVVEMRVFDSNKKDEAQHYFSQNQWNKVLVCNTGLSEEELKSYFPALEINFVGPDSYSGIKWAYPQPENLGKDRIAALIGAQKLAPKKNICVADAGTCLTIDLLDSGGNHLGGTISPGLQMRLQAMHEKTKKLPLSSENEAFNIRGNSTLSCLASGAVWGMVSEIEFHFLQMQREGFQEPVLFLTGGDADFLAQRLKVPNFVRTDLVFQGMMAVMATID